MAIGATAQAAVTIGSNLADSPDDNTPCTAVPCTISGQRDGDQLVVLGPVRGNTVSLRILRTGGGVSYAGAGTRTSPTSVAYLTLRKKLG